MEDYPGDIFVRKSGLETSKRKESHDCTKRDMKNAGRQIMLLNKNLPKR